MTEKLTSKHLHRRKRKGIETIKQGIREKERGRRENFF